VAKIKVTKKRVEELTPYSRNSRTHSDAQVAQIAASIREFGFINPVLVDAENNIIAGHGRVLAARKLGLEEVPCVLHDHLTETQRKAYILADNKLALNAGWDEDMLRLELRELGDMGFDLELTGFDEVEVEALNHKVNIDDFFSDREGEVPKEPKLCPHCGGVL
jgi:ParB-like chromosome segregation protein Spo0J